MAFVMFRIDIKTGKMTRGQVLFVDIVAKLSGEKRYLGYLKYQTSGLYQIPMTHKHANGGISIHQSYHPKGEIQGKLIEGNLLITPPITLIGSAKPHSGNEELITYKRTGQPWISLVGVERFDARGNDKSLSIADFSVCALSYPLYSPNNANNLFVIDCMTPGVVGHDLGFYLVEPGNRKALDDEIGKRAEDKGRLIGTPQFDKAVIYTLRKPWLAVVLIKWLEPNKE